MLLFPNAKINIGLNIINKRPDGYHNLNTVFYPIPLKDALEITESNDKNQNYTLAQTGDYLIDGNIDDNLIIKAYNLLKKDYNLPPININFIKKIPVQAGLGGGSSNAAFMLKAINQYLTLNLSDEQLEQYATTLGADCPFFIKNRPTFAEGIGEIFTPIDFSLKGYQIMILKADVAVSTADAFAAIKPHEPNSNLIDAIKRPIHEWKDFVINDFEASVFPKYPIIKELKELLYANGALYASMSGSGSAVYGIFERDTQLPELSLAPNTFCFKATLE